MGLNPQNNWAESQANDVRGKDRWKYHHYRVDETDLEFSQQCQAFQAEKLVIQDSENYALEAVPCENHSLQKADVLESLKGWADQLNFPLNDFNVDVIVYLAELKRWRMNTGLTTVASAEIEEWEARQNQLAELHKIRQNNLHSEFMNYLEYKTDAYETRIAKRKSKNQLRLQSLKDNLVSKKNKQLNKLCHFNKKDIKCWTELNQAKHSIAEPNLKLTSAKNYSNLPDFPIEVERCFGISNNIEQFVSTNIAKDGDKLVEIKLDGHGDRVNVVQKVLSDDDLQISASKDIFESQAAIKSTLYRKRYSRLFKRKYIIDAIKAKDCDFSYTYESDSEIDEIETEVDFSLEPVCREIDVAIKNELQSIEIEKAIIALASAATAEKLKNAQIEFEHHSENEINNRIKQQKELEESHLYRQHATTFVQQCLLGCARHLVLQYTEQNCLIALNDLSDKLVKNIDLSGTLIQNSIVSGLNERVIDSYLNAKNKLVENTINSCFGTTMSQPRKEVQIDKEKVKDAAMKDLKSLI
eukprot:NODE_58_length_28395_cov_1.465720.p3 type:complete len:527 gc:universal NODE_58_length_28395_cov_1.465720:4765-6345(+)